MSELTIKDFKSKYEPIWLSMELKSQGQSAYETGKIGGHTPLYTDEQIQDYLSNQPQLTIPAWVAKYRKALEWDDDRHSADGINPYREKGDENRFWNWRRIGDNNLIYRIYKACREMEADIQLVKVVEG